MLEYKYYLARWWSNYPNYLVSWLVVWRTCRNFFAHLLPLLVKTPQSHSEVEEYNSFNPINYYLAENAIEFVYTSNYTVHDLAFQLSLSNTTNALMNLMNCIKNHKWLLCIFFIHRNNFECETSTTFAYFAGILLLCLFMAHRRIFVYLLVILVMR